MTDLATSYEHENVEEKWYPFWEASGYFKPSGDGKPMSMVIPPPNVTGALHMGHALNNTLQDIVARFYRLQGRRVLWVPGTDHAGIATQNVVEKQLAKEGLSRDQLGRDAFVKRVWEWKEQYGNTITRQLRKLGASVDWSHERFTMDEGCSRAVRTNFVRLYEDGLIYRDEYIINWCPRCHTAISDIEVEHHDAEGHLWHLRYPINNGNKDDVVVVATTRPETMFGDTAVAVNPKDPRYAHLIGKDLILPFTDRTIPVIADDHVDMSFGSGAVKVTPAHDPNDFHIGIRHQLPRIVVLDSTAHMNENAPQQYQGLDRYACRKQLITDLDKAGFLEKTDKHAHSVGHCYRCQTTIEPYLSKQWFVRMEKLAPEPIAVVRDHSIEFIPQRWTKLYFDWMENIRPWCISRQIWWGHRIPVWYCEDCGKEIASTTTPTQCPACQSKNLSQDEDVLDTWFSSALWPFSTLGWPDKTSDLAAFYPTTILITGYDIITFWVSRMITMGLYNMKKIPFKDVFIHGLVRDAQGRKMSKSIGNVIDPLIIIKEKGADVLRFTLASLVTSGGQDIRLMDEKITSSRNFINKLWNMSRYVLMQEPATASKLDGQNKADQWILAKLSNTLTLVQKYYQSYDFSFVIESLYEFVWNDFCDWYLEMTKLHKETSQATLVFVLNAILKLLHPVTPFITEELWHKLKEHPHFPAEEKDHPTLMTSAWPTMPTISLDVAQSLETVDLMKNIIKEIRNIKAEAKIPLNKKGTLYIIGREKELTPYTPYMKLLARLDDVCFTSTAPAEKHLFAIIDDVKLFIPLEGLIDSDKERERLKKEADKLSGDIERLRAKLNNEGFIDKAPPAVISLEQKNLAERTQQLKVIQSKLADL